MVTHFTKSQKNHSQAGASSSWSSESGPSWCREGSEKIKESLKFFYQKHWSIAQEVIKLNFQPKAFKHLNKIHSKNYQASSNIMQLHLQRPLPSQAQNEKQIPDAWNQGTLPLGVSWFHAARKQIKRQAVDIVLICNIYTLTIAPRYPPTHTQYIYNLYT